MSVDWDTLGPRALAGDDEAWGVLLLWLRGYAYALARKWNAPAKIKGDLHELATDAVVSVIRFGPRYDPSRPMTFKSYCIEIVKSTICNKVISRRRRHMPYARLRFDPPACREPDVWAQDHARHWVEVGMRRVPKPHRPIVLRYHDGETYAEIGASLGVAKARVWQIVGEAQRKMRRELEGAGYGPLV